MSQFKLDFDISSPNPVRRLVPRVLAACPRDEPLTRNPPRPPPPRPPPQRRASNISGAPVQPIDKHSVAPPPVDLHRRPEGCQGGTAAVAKPTGARRLACLAGTPTPSGKGLRIPAPVVGVVIVLCLWCTRARLSTPSSPASDPRHLVGRARGLRKAGGAGHVCLRHSTAMPTVTCENTCGAGHTCVAQFPSSACADNVQSMHVHYADGRTERMPAVFQRVPNTTMFFLGAGDRTTFHPAACRVQLSAVFVPPAQTQTSALRAHLVWLAPATAKTFRVLEDSATGNHDPEHVATVDANLVRDRCVQADVPYCVHKLEMHCHERPLHVFAVDPGGGKDTRLTTFVYC